MRVKRGCLSAFVSNVRLGNVHEITTVLKTKCCAAFIDVSLRAAAGPSLPEIRPAFVFRRTRFVSVLQAALGFTANLLACRLEAWLKRTSRLK
jgi:hypothetical protein